MASWLMRIVLSSGKSTCNRRAICSGLQARAHLRSFRGPCRRPFHGTAGPETGALVGGMRALAGAPTAKVRKAGLSASLVDFALLGDRPAWHWAVVALSPNPPLRVAALRLSSREIVE